MDELAALRKKKLEALQQHNMQPNQQAAMEQHKLQQQIAQLEGMVKPMLSKEALTRYGAIKIAHPEKAIQVLVLVAQAMQSGHNKIIDDTTFKTILQKLTPEKKNITIKRA